MAHYKAQHPNALLVLGHGTGAGQQHPFMVSVAEALAERGIDVATFDFPYMRERRKVPDKGTVLEQAFREAVTEAAAWSPGLPLFIGGKSMGGRIATQVAAADPQLRLAGLVLLGYPLHPPGKPTQRRDKHLPAIARPMLFVQGTRDAFGTPDELAPIVSTLRPVPTVHVVAHGDHSFKLSRKDPAAQANVYADVQQAIVAFIRRVSDVRLQTSDF